MFAKSSSISLLFCLSSSNVEIYVAFDLFLDSSPTSSGCGAFIPNYTNIKLWLLDKYGWGRKNGMLWKVCPISAPSSYMRIISLFSVNWVRRSVSSQTWIPNLSMALSILSLIIWAKKVEFCTRTVTSLPFTKVWKLICQSWSPISNHEDGWWKWSWYHYGGVVGEHLWWWRSSRHGSCENCGGGLVPFFY